MSASATKPRAGCGFGITSVLDFFGGYAPLGDEVQRAIAEDRRAQTRV